MWKFSTRGGFGPILHFLKSVEIGGVFLRCVRIFAVFGPYLNDEWPDIFHTLKASLILMNWLTDPDELAD